MLCFICISVGRDSLAPHPKLWCDPENKTISSKLLKAISILNSSALNPCGFCFFLQCRVGSAVGTKRHSHRHAHASTNPPLRFFQFFKKTKLFEIMKKRRKVPSSANQPVKRTKRATDAIKLKTSSKTGYVPQKYNFSGFRKSSDPSLF